MYSSACPQIRSMLTGYMQCLYEYATSGTAVTTVVESTVNVCRNPGAPGANQKRAAAATKPSCFSKYTAAPLISSACKCLSVPTSTTTKTVSSAAAASVTVTTVSLTHAQCGQVPRCSSHRQVIPTTTVTSYVAGPSAFPATFKLARRDAPDIYAAIGPDQLGPTEGFAIYYNSPSVSATAWRLNEQGYLVAPSGLFAYTLRPDFDAPQAVYFDIDNNPGYDTLFPVFLTCQPTVNADTGLCELQCQSFGGNVASLGINFLNVPGDITLFYGNHPLRGGEIRSSCLRKQLSGRAST